MIRRITPWPSRPPFGVCTYAAVPVALGGGGGGKRGIGYLETGNSKPVSRGAMVFAREDLRHGYDHLLLYTKTTLALKASQSMTFRRCYGPEFIAEAVRDWIAAFGAKTAYVEPGSPWENGYCDSFNARFRDELLNGELFYRLWETQNQNGCDRCIVLGWPDATLWESD